MNNKRVGIIGVGNVGATLAYTLVLKDICSEILLKDINEDLTQAMMLDISQASFATKQKTKLFAVNKNEDFCNCDVVVITAGIARRPGMSRDDLLNINAQIIETLMMDVIAFNPNAIIIIVSNPLDAMVYKALEVSKYPRNKIFGMAGILDSSRMSYFIYEKLNANKEEIFSSVMGGHGNEMVPLVSYSKVSNKFLDEVLSKEDIDEIINQTKSGGAQIVNLLKTGSAYFAPANSTAVMIDAILNDKKEIYPCSVMLNGEYGYEDVVAGVPVILGKNGVEEIIKLDLSEAQKVQFDKSINAVIELIEILKEKKKKI
ncbi:MAG: malate dehydrogenase [Arcobacter sp.]|uniref:malate dehydrogenase n=1 Tax=Arcobacter sp. TaxID=1872629 RepID=UPI002A75F64A|nr:malate dehydrogenase [Arcobacter sp.]MDY3205413.1 malate dehydrogenase [Arcobacter sp.]